MRQRQSPGATRACITQMGEQAVDQHKSRAKVPAVGAAHRERAAVENRRRSEKGLERQKGKESERRATEREHTSTLSTHSRAAYRRTKSCRTASGPRAATVGWRQRLPPLIRRSIRLHPCAALAAQSREGSCCRSATPQFSVSDRASKSTDQTTKIWNYGSRRRAATSAHIVSHEGTATKARDDNLLHDWVVYHLGVNVGRVSW